MNLQTFAMLLVLNLMTTFLMFILIKETKQNPKVKKIQYIVVVIFSLILFISSFYIPKLTSFLGGGAIKKSSYEITEKKKEIVVPSLNANDVIDYKKEGRKDLNNSLKE